MPELSVAVVSEMLNLVGIARAGSDKRYNTFNLDHELMDVATGQNLYGAFSVKRISSRASLTSLELNRVRSPAVARLQ